MVAGTSCKKTDGVELKASAAAYQPFSANSYWKYRVVIGSKVDTTTTTMTANTATFNNKIYHTVTSASTAYAGVQTGYMYADNHNYSIRATTLINGITVDIVYLNDAATTWTNKITDSGFINGVPAQIIGTLVDANISKTVSGKTYNNVIHTKVDLQYNLTGTGFSSVTVYDYYIAKGIGIIENDATINAFGYSTTSTTSLIDYAIK